MDAGMNEDTVIWDAEFNPSVTTYWLLNGIIVCLVTVVGIPLIPIWFLAGKWFTGKYLESHKCTLTDRSLKVSKGVFVRIEKTVPLDRITDVGIVQGPVMRYFEIEALSVETAGQSAVGSLISLAGIKDGRKFRDAVLQQRDLVVGTNEKTQAMPTNPESIRAESVSLVSASKSVELLQQIRDSLARIESRLDDKSK